jgi:hypothetical protein
MSENNSAQQNNEQLLNDIQSLQTIEQQLFSSLENNPSLTTTQQQKIVEKMNQLSNMRINLYQTLSGVNNYYQNALTSTAGTLKDQTAAIYIVESELNKSKERLALLDTEKNNKIRLVEINNYYGDKYAEHGNLMKIIILTLVPIIILALLNNHDILPSSIYYGLVSIIAFIGGYFFWIRFGSIITRDNMNYQTYDWYFDPASAPTSTSTTSDDPWSSGDGYGTCIGDGCCSTGLTYDSSLNQCVLPTTSTASTTTTATTVTPTSSTSSTEGFISEGFIQSVLTKKDPNKKYKNDVVLNSDAFIKPNSSNSFIYK